MHRREFLCTVAAAGVGTVVGQAHAASTPARPSRLMATPVSWMAPRTDGFDAVWSVTELCRGRVEWETEGERGVAAADPFGFVPQGDRLLRVRLGGLKPGRTYRMRAVTSAAADSRVEMSDWRELRTLDAGAASTRFVVWNDTHVNNDTIRKLDDVTPAADFLMWNGDTCNDWKSEDLLIPTLLHPGEREITAKRPLLLTWGNHDSRGAYAFRMPACVATPSGRPFYAFRSGPVAFICLHTGEDKPDDHPTFKGRPAFDALRAEQAAWLAEVIRRPEFAQAPYRIVICHIPLRWLDESPQDYANGGFDRHSGRSRAAWHDSLVAWKAQLVISGHTHHAAWLPATREFPYAQMVGGGPRPEAATWMEGVADASAFTLTVRDLGGTVVHKAQLAPLA